MRYNDKSWVRGLFGQGAFQAGTKGEDVKEYTAINGSFADTSIGGNQAINPIPQFTRYADIKAYGYLARQNGTDIINNNQAGSYGMGRFYGENIDNNAHYAHFRFGVPKYIGALSFLITMHSPDLARLTTDGMFTSFFRTVGKVGTYIGMFVVLGPAIVLPLLAGTKLIDMFLNASASKYWYVKPMMHLYLQSVQSMLDTQLVHSRLVPFSSILNNHGEGDDATEEGNKLNETMRGMYAGLPSIWKSSGKFDVFKMVNRYQILADFESRNLERIYNESNGDPVAYNRKINEWVNSSRTKTDMQTRSDMELNLHGKHVSILEGIANAYANSTMFQVDDKADRKDADATSAMAKKLNSQTHSVSAHVAADADKQEQADKEAALKGKTSDKPLATLKDVVTNTWDAMSSSTWGTQLLSELHDGAQWITFKVDGKSSVSDSFGNSTVEPQIASAINGISSQARSMDMSLSGGNTGFAAVDAITDSVKGLLSGTLDALNLSGIAGVFGKSSVDIPEMWDSSNADIATESYTLQLRSPYGNDISRFQCIMVPLMFILGGVMPMSTGKQTYRNPFYCEVISRGRNTIRNGMITNVSITRGAGNMGWRADGKMLGCDVTITVKDLTKVVAMPVIKDKRIFADDNTYTDYMATLGSASLHDLTYKLAKLTINFNNWKQSWKSAFMSGRITNTIGAGGPARLISNIVTGTARN